MIISIPLQTILDRIHTRNYYVGESYKAKDLDYSIVQSSYDNIDELKTSVESALDEVVGMFLKRAKEISYVWGNDRYDITIVPYGRIPDNGEEVLRLLGNAITDYCAQYSIYQWLLVLKPDIANPIGSLLPNIINKITKYIGMISDPVRRRYTPFGI